MRIVFFGSPDIAVPTLVRLLGGPHEVVGVVSQPDRRRGRGRKTSPTPVAELALAHDLPLLRPEKVGDAEVVDALRALEPDIVWSWPSGSSSRKRSASCRAAAT